MKVVFVLRWVDSTLTVHEDFLGLYEVDSIAAATLVKVLKDCLLRLNISMNKVRGQCYDGASNMAGIRQGVATVVQEEQSNAFFTHCYGHSLNLATSDMVKGCTTMKKMLDTVQEITKLVKYSPRRQALFEKLKEEIAPGCPGVRVLCPTRWTVKADAMSSIVHNYGVLQNLWEVAVTVLHDTEVIARVQGVESQMQTFDFFFGLVLGETLFRHSDNLSRTLQKKDFSAVEAQVIAEKTVATLQGIRNDDSFESFWEKVTVLASRNGVNDPILPRRRKRPSRFEEGQAPHSYAVTPKDMYRVIYFEAFDLLVQSINTRFDQPGYRAYCCLQSLLMKAVEKQDFSSELTEVMRIYGDDFNGQSLQLQLQILVSTVPEDIHTIMEVLSYLKEMPASEKELINEVVKLAKLILVMPATNSTSERSFSALRRLKTYLRSTMTQQRLNNLMILHVHKELTDELKMKEIANEFIGQNERRAHIFGKFV